MKEIGKERKIAIAALIVAVLMLTVAFAAMSRTLKINGTAKVDSAAWDIHFKSASMTNKKGDAREVAEPVIDNGGIDLTLKVGLRKPKDEITYEAIIENSGDIDAEIESIEYPNLTDDQAKIIEFEATYASGDKISEKQSINSGEEKTVKIVIRYKDITDESLLAKEAYDVPLTFKINYIQKGFNTESIPEGGEIVDDNSKAVLASTDVFSAEDPSVAPFANSPIGRNEIETLSFVKGSNNARSGNTWDASEAGDGSIIGYYEDTDGNGLYEVVIESSSNIYAPADASCLLMGFFSTKEIKLDNFRTDDTTNMMWMFAGCFGLPSSFSINTSKVTNMSYMFAANPATTLDLTSFDTSNVTDMSYMFWASSSLITVDMSNLDVSNVTTMECMFMGSDGGYMGIKNIYMTGWDTSNVTNMTHMFHGCSSLSSLDLSSFNTSNVTDMSFMFDDCSSLTNLNINHFNTVNVTDMYDIFKNCSSLIILDLSTWNISAATEISGMFYNCESLSELKLNSADLSAESHDGSGMTSWLRNIKNATIYVKDENAKRFVEKYKDSTVTVIIEPLQF